MILFKAILGYFTNHHLKIYTLLNTTNFLSHSQWVIQYQNVVNLQQTIQNLHSIILWKRKSFDPIKSNANAIVGKSLS